MWTRLLALELGHTTASAGAVLAAFMGGLALGALAAGRKSPLLTSSAGLRAYAALEVAIAVFALAVPFEISAIHPLLALAYGEGPGGFLFQALRLSTALLVVGLPAALMGATYPLVIVEGRAAGTLYAANTTGAAIGAMATGFILLPRLGLFGSTLVGVTGNALVATVVWRLAGKGRQSHLNGEQSQIRELIAPIGVTVPLILLATAVAGYAALSLEIAWTRTFAMVMGPTTYAFTATVSCFIVGLAAGAGTAAWFLKVPPQGSTGRFRRKVPPGGSVGRFQRLVPTGGSPSAEGWLGLALAAAALAIGLAMTGVDDFVIAVARRTLEPGISYNRLLVTELLGAAGLLIPIAFCSGAAFPLALAAARAEAGRDVASIYAANTAGAIAGALLTAGVTIRAWGLQGTFLLTVALLGAMSLVLVLLSARGARWIGIATVAVLIAAAGIPVKASWNVELLSSGAYKYAAYLGAEDLDARLGAGTVNYYREGATGTVAVRELAGVRTLSIDGKVDASNGGDMLTQRLLAHLPLLVRPGATRAAIIGLGSGVTLGSALTYPLQQVDVIEISPEVIEASEWFAEENGQALHDPRVRLIRGDARTHFRLTPSRYDVIISEPSNPWMAGVAALFTREFFQALHSRLAPGGVVCQWAHTYDIAEDDLKSIVGTFLAVFTHGSAWLVGGGDLLLISGERPPETTFPHRPTTENSRRDLEASGVPSLAVLEQLRIGDAVALGSWTGSPRIESDDRMALEFSAPAATVGASRQDNATALRRLARPPVAEPVVLRDAGLLALRAQAPDRAWEFLNSAVTHLPADPATLEGLVRAAAMSPSTDRLRAAESQLRHSIAMEPKAIAPRLELARLQAARGDYADAQQTASDAERIAPAAPEVQEELAAIAADAGDAAALTAALVRLRELQPRGGRTSYFEAVLYMITGHAAEAIPFAREAVRSDQARAPAWNLLGSALGATNAPDDEIRNAFTRAVRADRSDAAAYANLGMLELSSGRAASAANWFAQALTVDPANAAARKGLAAARAAMY